ncbi:unnamed protein product, partial [Iphiclides podalirius]
MEHDHIQVCGTALDGARRANACVRLFLETSQLCGSVATNDLKRTTELRARRVLLEECLLSIPRQEPCGGRFIRCFIICPRRPVYLTTDDRCIQGGAVFLNTGIGRERSDLRVPRGNKRRDRQVMLFNSHARIWRIVKNLKRIVRQFCAGSEDSGKDLGVL